MKPSDDVILNVKRAAGLRGGEGLPLSGLAAANPGQRAENFRFGPQDQALVAAVLADLRDSDNGSAKP